MVTHLRTGRVINPQPILHLFVFSYGKLSSQQFSKNVNDSQIPTMGAGPKKTVKVTVYPEKTPQKQKHHLIYIQKKPSLCRFFSPFLRLVFFWIYRVLSRHEKKPNIFPSFAENPQPCPTSAKLLNPWP